MQQTSIVRSMIPIVFKPSLLGLVLLILLLCQKPKPSASSIPEMGIIDSCLLIAATLCWREINLSSRFISQRIGGFLPRKVNHPPDISIVLDVADKDKTTAYFLPDELISRVFCYRCNMHALEPIPLQADIVRAAKARQLRMARRFYHLNRIMTLRDFFGVPIITRSRLYQRLQRNIENLMHLGDFPVMRQFTSSHAFEQQLWPHWNESYFRQYLLEHHQHYLHLRIQGHFVLTETVDDGLEELNW